MVEFNSYNTQRLTVEEVKQKLLALEYVKTELSSASNPKRGYRE